MIYIGIPFFETNTAPPIEVMVIEMIRGSSRRPDEVGLAPRIDWKYNGRRYICKMKPPPKLESQLRWTKDDWGGLHEIPDYSDGNVPAS
jgi:hypothetical protein